MTALAFENAMSAAVVRRPSRVVQPRRAKLASTSSAFAQLPGYVPAWLMPEHHADSRFIELATMSGSAVGMALMASGVDLAQLRREKGVRRPLEFFIPLAMAGVDAVGAAGCRRTATAYEYLLRHHQTTASGSAHGIAPEGSTLDRILTTGAHRYERSWALNVGFLIVADGFHHEQARGFNDYYRGRCIWAGVCAHCYPENFTASAVAR